MTRNIAEVLGHGERLDRASPASVCPARDLYRFHISAC